MDKITAALKSYLDTNSKGGKPTKRPVKPYASHKISHGVLHRAVKPQTHKVQVHSVAYLHRNLDNELDMLTDQLNRSLHVSGPKKSKKSTRSTKSKTSRPSRPKPVKSISRPKTVRDPMDALISKFKKSTTLPKEAPRRSTRSKSSVKRYSPSKGK